MEGSSSIPTFAIVIPTYNEERNIERLLHSIQSQRGSTYSIALVDQSSKDRTVEIAGSFGCTVIQIPSSRFYSPPARSRNLGAKAIDGRILLHLDADMELDSPDFLNQLESKMDIDHRAVIIHEQDVASGFWATCKALERSCYRGTEMEAARAVTRDLFTKVGGYDEDISSGEDFYITRLYELETEVARDHSLHLRHYLGTYTLLSLVRKKFAYGRTAKTYLVKAKSTGAHSAGSIVRSSMRAYIRSWRLLGTQPVHYLAIFPLRAVEFAVVHLGMWLGPSRYESSKSLS